jgi:hypothetical protein
MKKAAEHLALYQGASLAVEQEYRNRRAEISLVADTKRLEYEAGRGYEDLRSNINEGLLVLEIITHTPILTKELTMETAE